MFFVLLLLQSHTCTKFIVPEAHLQAKSIGVSPVVIAHKNSEVSQVFTFANSMQPYYNRTTVKTLDIMLESIITGKKSNLVAW